MGITTTVDFLQCCELSSWDWYLLKELNLCCLGFHYWLGNIPSSHSLEGHSALSTRLFTTSAGGASVQVWESQDEGTRLQDQWCEASHVLMIQPEPLRWFDDLEACGNDVNVKLAFPVHIDEVVKWASPIFIGIQAYPSLNQTVQCKNVHWQKNFLAICIVMGGGGGLNSWVFSTY